MALVALALLRGLLYALLTPPWQAPDETAHFEYSHLLARHGRLLSFADSSPELEGQIIRSLYTYRAWDYLRRTAPAVAPERLNETPFFGRSRTLARFSLAYVPYALAVWPFLNYPVEVQLYVMRLVSVLLSVAMIGVTLFTARRLEPDRPALALGAGLLVLFWPQHTYIMATVSDGNLAELLAALAVYHVLVMLQAGFNWRRAGLAVMCGALALFTKATAYYLVLLGVLVALDGLWHWARRITLGRGWHRRHFVVALAAVAACAVLVLWLWLLIPSQAGVFTGFQSILFSLRRPMRIVANVIGVAVDGSLLDALRWNYYSFWGAYGWVVQYFPHSWYLWIGAGCGLSAFGWLASCRARRWAAGTGRSYAFLVLAAALPLLAMYGLFLVWPMGIRAFQGRYLFVGLAPLAVVLVRGWLALAPAGRSALALTALTLGLVLLDTAALLLVVVPYFYG